jgi:16S rRNA (uracil1498-N3)-methyltransferase
MPQRFFVLQLPGLGDEVALPDEEAHHLRVVMRLGECATVHVFDGRGRECRATVTTVGRRGVSVRLEAEVVPAPERRAAVALVQGILRLDRMDDVIRDAVMMGVARLVPLVSANVSVAAGTLKGDRVVDRWRRVALSSAKQCGRAVVPEVTPPLAFDRWIAQPSGAARLVLVEPGARAVTGIDPAMLRDDALRGGAEVAIGPEGGWSPAELEALVERGVRAWSLGGRTLRADSVPVAALAVLEYLWER